MIPQRSMNYSFILCERTYLKKFDCQLENIFFSFLCFMWPGRLVVNRSVERSDSATDGKRSVGLNDSALRSEIECCQVTGHKRSSAYYAVSFSLSLLNSVHGMHRFVELYGGGGLLM